MNNILSQVKLNWKAGLTVALVNVPMSLALSIASGATPAAGIVTAIWAGLISALIGGSIYNIVGPAGALSGILASYALMYGASVLPVIAIISGILILIAWFFRLDRYIVFIPSSVIHGFTLAVAITIGLGQLNAALGLKGLVRHDTFTQNTLESLRNLTFINWTAFSLFAAGFIILFALLRLAPKFPGIIAVAAMGIGAGYASTVGWFPLVFETVQSKFGSVTLKLFTMPELSLSAFNMTVIKAAPLVAVIVVLETLLSAKVADGMTKTKFNQRKEVLGIALANIGSGFFGGLPATGVFARTALNIRSGATSNYSAIINVLVVTLISFVLLPGFSFLPMPIVASILVFLSFRMVAAEHFVNLYKFDKTACGLSLAVAALCVIYDPLIGILAGSAVSLLFFVNYLSQAQGEILIGDAQGEMSRLHPSDFDVQKTSGNTLIYRFVGELNYMNAERHREFVHRINGDHFIVLNFRNLFYVDIDGLEAVDEIVHELESRGKEVFLSGIAPQVHPLFAKKAWFVEIQERGLVVKNTSEALAKIKVKRAAV
ncbi:MAG: SulP family inorganic anion transporter [Patescibacteria group bacterium]